MASERHIYFDHAATTPVHPAAREAMHEVLGERFGNPSSVHRAGRRARDAVERARDEIAALVGASAEEVVLTSGGTEADNLGLLGGARAMRAREPARRRVVVSPLEHPAVLGAVERLGAEGFEVVWLPVRGDGTLDEAAALDRIDERTAIVSLAAVNHELGVVYPVAALAAAARAAGAPVHCDAVQAAGRVALDVGALGVDLLALSSHKLYGPKGAGALVVRRGTAIAPRAVGGHQERERRAGTENVPGVVGFGVACALARRERDARRTHLERLGARLERGLMAIDGARRYGPAEGRAPGIVTVAFAGASGELVAMALDLAGVAVSTGAACTSGALEPSRVVMALGVGRAAAAEAVRFSLGRDNSDAEVDEVLGLLPPIVARCRAAAG